LTVNFKYNNNYHPNTQTDTHSHNRPTALQGHEAVGNLVRNMVITSTN